MPKKTKSHTTGGGKSGSSGGVKKPGGVKKRSKVVSKDRMLAAGKKNRKLRKTLAGTIVTSGLDDDTVKHYLRIRGSTATTSQKRKASEAMGESGAVAYLRDRTGNDLGLVRPTKTKPFDLSFDDGIAWDSAIAFNGSGVADVVYWDGATLHVIEAKGGGSTLKMAGLSGRKQKYYPDTGTTLPSEVRQSADAPQLSQGTIPYLTDTAHNMSNSNHEDNRADAGHGILDAIANDTVEYVPVSTKVEEGDSTATVSVMDSD